MAAVHSGYACAVLTCMAADSTVTPYREAFPFLCADTVTGALSAQLGGHARVVISVFADSSANSTCLRQAEFRASEGETKMARERYRCEGAAIGSLPCRGLECILQIDN